MRPRPRRHPPPNPPHLDLRREFHAKLEVSGIAWTSVLNGGFMELLVDGDAPLINATFHRIMHFGSADQQLDLTTMPDTAAFTAAVAADPSPTPKYLRIAGDTFSATELAAAVSRVRGQTYTTQWVGSVGFMRALIWILKLVIGGVDDKELPPWQGLQYLENMVSGKGKLNPLDNNRYPELEWTSIEKALAEADAKKTN